MLVPKDDDGMPVWVDREHPAAGEVRVTDFVEAVGEVGADPHADNLLFIGDSLDVLRVLSEVPEYRHHYRGKVKLVYIDPPFNTGQAFAHYDDWLEHATWLSFMRERLLLIQELLSPDGSVWVHLDAGESHRMRLLLDEVFGPSCFVAEVIWEKVYSPRMDAQQFSSSHDTILVYGASRDWVPNSFEVEPDLSQFRHVDSDGRRYRSDPLRKWGKNSDRADRPNLWYPLQAPSGEEVWPIKPDGTEGNWRWGRDTYLERQAELDWVDKGNGLQPYVRQYADASTRRPPETLWKHTEVGHNHEAAQIIKALGLGKFSTPKPERLLERVIHIGSDPGDIVLDSFAGSGTTAVVAHKMNRRWLTAELSARTVSTFTQPRLTAVVHGNDPGGITNAVGWTGGGGFRVVEVGPSMYTDTPFGVLLSDNATNGMFSRAVAGQLGYTFQPDAAPLCGARGRMRLAVLDGVVGEDEVQTVLAAIGDEEHVEIVGKAIRDGAADLLAKLSKGSKITKAPRDLLTRAAQRTRRRAERAASR